MLNISCLTGQCGTHEIESKQKMRISFLPGWDALCVCVSVYLGLCVCVSTVHVHLGNTMGLHNNFGKGSQPCTMADGSSGVLVVSL